MKKFEAEVGCDSGSSAANRLPSVNTLRPTTSLVALELSQPWVIPREILLGIVVAYKIDT